MAINLDGIKPISDVIVTCLVGDGGFIKAIVIEFPRPIDGEIVKELQEVQNKVGRQYPLTGLDPTKSDEYRFDLVIKEAYNHLEIADRIVSHLKSTHKLSVKSRLQIVNGGFQYVESFSLSDYFQ